MPAPTSIFFASDFHLGIPTHSASIEREKRIVRWLESIEGSAEQIYLVGDIFDFWFTFRKAIPKGFVRLQGKLAALSDAGIPIHLFAGNHDMWGLEYFSHELGLIIHQQPILTQIKGKTFFIGHGDGLGPGDARFKLLKIAFRSRFFQWLFSVFHPNIGVGIAQHWSAKSRLSKGFKEQFKGMNEEWLVTFAYEELKKTPVDYFIFGHRHLALDIKLNERSRYINLGEWVSDSPFAEFDGTNVSLHHWDG